MAEITTGTGVPCEFRAGNTIRWTTEDSAHPSSSWALVYAFKRDVCGTVIEVEAAANGGDDGFTAELTPTISDRFKTGVWAWYAQVTSTSEGTTTAAQGRVTVKANPLAEEDKSYAQKMLDEVRQVQLKRAGKAYNGATVGGGDMQYKTDDELRMAEQHWLSRVNQERRTKRGVDTGEPHHVSKIRFKTTV